jgi:hypothetical protein
MKEDNSPDKPQPYDSNQIKKQIEEYSKNAMKEVFCETHPSETKLHRRYQNESTCRKVKDN